MWPSRTAAHQVPLSMGFPSQEYWSGLPCPSPGDLPNPGIKPSSLALAGRFFTTEPYYLLHYDEAPESHSESLQPFRFGESSIVTCQASTSWRGTPVLEKKRFFFFPLLLAFWIHFIIALVHLNVNILWDEVRVKSLVCTVLFSILFSKVPAIWDLLKNYFCIYFIFGYVWSWLWHAGSFLVAQCSLFLGALELSHCAQAYSPQGMWDLSSQTRDWTYISHIGRQTLNHSTTKEVPIWDF